MDMKGWVVALSLAMGSGAGVAITAHDSRSGSHPDIVASLARQSTDIALIQQNIELMQISIDEKYSTSIEQQKTTIELLGDIMRKIE